MTKPHKYSSKQLLWKQMFKSASSLSLFTFIGISLLLGVMQLTKDDIAKAERKALLSAFNQVLPAHYYNNDPLQDTKTVISEQHLGTPEPVTIYRARLDGKPVGIILETIAPDGYTGNIHILIGVFKDGRISGVRVLKHRETPGLGDKIEIRRSNWITGFDAQYLSEDNSAEWRVKKDGGKFDQFTGATITPRAVVTAVRNTLKFINKKGEVLYE